MIGARVRLVLLVATLPFLAARCMVAAGNGGDQLSADVNRAREHASRVGVGNPLIRGGVTAEGKHEEDLQSCVTLSVDLEFDETRGVVGSLKGVNRCEHAVAVLLEPVELRLCGAGRRCFYEGPVLDGNAYARLYVFPWPEGFPKDLRGQFRLAVKGSPEFGRIEAGTTSEWSVQGGDEFFRALPAGEYGAFVETVGAPAGSATASTGTLDLDDSVKVHNLRTDSGAVMLHSGVKSLPCAIARFRR